MKLTSKHQMKSCPACGSKNVLTSGLDQMCCTCDWDNSRLLVQLGQFDHLSRAAQDHIKMKSFADLERKESKIKSQNSKMNQKLSLTA